MAEVILKCFKSGTNCLWVPIETAICISVIEYTKCSLNIVFLHDSKQDVHQIKYNLEESDLRFRVKKEGYKCLHTMLPTVVSDPNSSIAGLAAVLRQIVKSSEKQHLLGFRNCCLAAPAETSCWTRYCEVEVVNTLRKLILSESAEGLNDPSIGNTECNGLPHKNKDICEKANDTFDKVFNKNQDNIKNGDSDKECINELGNNRDINTENYIENNSFDNQFVDKKERIIKSKDVSATKEDSNCINELTLDRPVRELPEELAVLEHHLSIPARVHNRGKYGRNGPNHDYVEGPHMVLSDLVIATCINLILDYLQVSDTSAIPFVQKWLNRVSINDRFSVHLSRLVNISSLEKKSSWILPKLKNGPVDLYKKEGTRRKRIFTQGDLLSKSLRFIQQVKLMEYSKLFDESDLESISIILPDVPQDRLDRKVQQLANLAKAALQIAKPGDILVDFCCGSGHLGLLLAKHLPSCTVILLDNKETSMERAKLRVEQMRLNNVKVIQSNLDYFTAKFQVGLSLHACGVASDLVIMKCLLSKAHLVVCPCCYGAIQNNHMINYPQSSTFSETGLTEYDFVVLAHNADTYDSDQGRLAMTAVDTDRCLYIQQHGYNVTLSKLLPQDCTTRNNMIVGVLL